jgi:hypothetical protein
LYLEVMRMETTEFKDVRFMTAAEKKRVLRQFVRFLKSGFEARLFMKSLYHHLIQHCSFIAHYNLGGFYAVYFVDPSDTQRFLDQFDRSKGCVSVEYGYAWWINDEDYRDINNAMVDAAAGMLPTLRGMLKERETAKARQELEQAERRLKAVLATD